MSAEPLPYSQLYIKIWTVFSICLAVVLLSMFVFGPHLLHKGKIVWDLLRYIASPFI